MTLGIRVLAGITVKKELLGFCELVVKSGKEQKRWWRWRHVYSEKLDRLEAGDLPGMNLPVTVSWRSG